MATQSILIVDDEEDLASTLAYHFEREGLSVRIAHDGQQGLALAARQPPHLALLDVMLPDMSGLEVCRKLKALPGCERLPVMMLTARGEEIDRVVGFEAGADDYVTKPFSVRELTLRVRAVLRRAASTPADTNGTLHFGRLTLDAAAHTVLVDAAPVELTALEFRLVQTLLERKGRVQRRETLLEDVWGIRADVTTRTVDTHIKRLREKLGDAGSYIETIRGVGYRMLAKAPDADA